MESHATIKSYKTVLLGEAAVGKSSLILRFVSDQFDPSLETTVGAAFSTKNLDLGTDAGVIRFEIWDTAGQERFASIAPIYYRGAAAAIVVFDVTCYRSFERAQMWVQQLQLSAHSSTIIALVGNKSDLLTIPKNQSRSDVVDLTEAERYATDNGLFFLTASAKNGQNVDEIFQILGNELTHPSRQTESSIHSTGTIWGTESKSVIKLSDGHGTSQEKSSSTYSKLTSYMPSSSCCETS